MRSALRVHEHPAVVLPLDPVERGEHLVVLRGRDVRHELPAPRRHQEVEVPDLGGEAIVREVGDRFELAEIVRARGRLHDEGEPGPVEDLRSLHRVSPGAAHLPEAVVTIGIERIEGEREPARAGLRQPPRHVLGDAHAVGADDDPQFALRRAPDDLEDVAPQERLAARQDRQAFRREGGDFVDDPEAFLGAELAAIGEVLGADQRRAAGVEIAVLAGEVAAVGEVPGDDVGPGERLVLGYGMFIAMTRDSHAEEVSGRVEDLLVHFEGPSLPGEFLDAGPRHGADELGNVREPGFRGGSPPDGHRLGCLAGPALTVGVAPRRAFRWRDHRGERTSAELPAAASTRLGRSGPIRTPSDWTTCVSYALVSIAIS